MGRDLEIKPNCATNRTENGDFSTKVANHLAITPEERPWLFVVKKNKTVLDRLLKWIKNHASTGGKVPDLNADSMLIQVCSVWFSISCLRAGRQSKLP